jgi:hypothetical protein
MSGHLDHLAGPRIGSPQLATYVNTEGATVQAAQWLPGGRPLPYNLSLAGALGVSSYTMADGKLSACLMVYPGEIRCLEDGDWVTIHADGWKRIWTDEGFRATWRLAGK